MSIDKTGLLELIKSRRTCYLFNPKQQMPLTDQQIESCLEAAIWAPNHKLTQPWRFWVLGEQTQQDLAAVYALLRADKRAQAGSDNHQAIYASALTKFNEFPRIILVGQIIAQDEIVRKEDYAACACAIQNLQLMAWQEGIGVQWSTGPILQAQQTYQAIGQLPEQVELIGALYMGHLRGDCSAQNAKRKPVSDVTEWLV
ncbi:putative NAD(P)H nitroreductase YfhC [Thiosulfatimonas sediminis]|uniref:Putative NAD(P)H nitroreductase YfhC n=1 Tax=Thiosulfatimonas sediminis TaxID=2675054 RepID=A0A6F8PRA3_9GAMM|nr:nitroreductase [Thiosulfatimonas sediminis]BBP44662.1 putative NAD(P)H nitroreductase YfhC [Thiosulfatimonas sediminis]